MLVRRIRYAMALFLGVAVAAVGDITSFSNLRTYARQHDFPVDWGLPIGLDAGIPALLLLDSLRPSKFLRGAAWLLSAGTVAANAAVSPDHSWIARGLHGVMPALAILWYEAVRHLNDNDEGRMDRVRWARYVVSPVRTVRLRVRMIRWEVTSYTDAIRLESAILLSRAVLISEYDTQDWRGTRKRVPVILRHQLDTGQLPAELFFGTDWTPAVRAWVRTALEELRPAHRRVPEADEQTEQDPLPVPAVAQKDPWELIWELRDRLVPKGVPPEMIAKAYGIARAHFDQFNRHITVDDMREALRVRKDLAGTLARVFRTAYESDRELLLQWQDQSGEPGWPVIKVPGTVREPFGETVPDDAEPARAVGAP